ncbi:MAG: 7-carboxy-7-deazaguanine synthase QueE, partial [Nitrospinota bacterium]
DSGYTVMIETNGTVNLSPLPQGVIKIVDIKCPDSGSGGTFLYENLKCITANDELKFVVASKNDFDWAMDEINGRDLTSLCPVNISPAEQFVDAKDVALWILESGIKVRLNLQIHKLLGMK